MIDEGPDGPFAYAPLTPRDYFAAHALVGLLTLNKFPFKSMAEYSYELADSMLEERAKTK